MKNSKSIFARINLENRLLLAGTISQTQERGGVSVVVVFFMLFVLVVCAASVVNRFRETRAREESQVRLSENWEAKSDVAVLDRVVQNRLPAQYQRDLDFAKNRCAAPAGLDPFDGQDVPPANSRPVAIVAAKQTSCGAGGSNTSQLGNLAAYLSARQSYLQSEAGALGFTPDKVQIAALYESVRRFAAGAPPVYQIHYVLESRGGRYGRFRNEGDVLLGALAQSCGTTATIAADRGTVPRGQNLTLTVTYSMATDLKIYELNGGTLLKEASVAEDANPQTYVFTFAPTATDTYRVTATGSAPGCSSQSGNVKVDVVDPQNSCATNPPRISNFQSSSSQVNAGDTVMLQWATTGAVGAVTLNGTAVNQTANNYPAIVSADTVFTLLASGSDPVASCPAQQQTTVTVRRAAADCNLPAPTVAFTADRVSIQTGQAVKLAWNVGNLGASGQVVFTEANGATHSIPASGTDTRIFNVAGTYNFKVTGKNVCPEGSASAVEKTISIVVTTACAPPVINNFAANPSSVISGASQTVRLGWNLGGTVDSITLSGIGAVTGTYADIPQPQQTTTYTLTAAGCNQSATATATVTVAGGQSMTPVASLYGSANETLGYLDPVVCANRADTIDFICQAQVAKDGAGNYYVYTNGNSDDPASPPGVAAWSVFNTNKVMVFNGTGQGSFGPFQSPSGIGNISCVTARRKDYGPDCAGNQQIVTDAMTFDRANVGSGYYRIYP